MPDEPNPGGNDNPTAADCDPSTVNVAEKDIETEIAKKILERPAKELNKAVQFELGSLLSLASDLTARKKECRKTNSSWWRRFLQFLFGKNGEPAGEDVAEKKEVRHRAQLLSAIDGLLAEKPLITFARVVRQDLEAEIWQRGWFWQRFGKTVPAYRVLLGLAIALVLLIAFTISATLYHLNVHKTVEKPVDPDLLLLQACAGGYGAVLSVMARLNSFNKIHAPPFTMVVTGFSKPIIGVIFAAFAVIVLNSELISVQTMANHPIYTAFAIAFAAGISERFSQDLVTRVSASAGASVKAAKDEPATSANTSG